MLFSEKGNHKQTVRVVPSALGEPYILQNIQQDIHPSVTVKAR